MMHRKKIVGQLQPLKVTKTEANYQSLLLQMMSKLVTEQRESNRLLKKIAGQNNTSNASSKISVFTSPKKRDDSSLVSFVMESQESSPKKKGYESEGEDDGKSSSFHDPFARRVFYPSPNKIVGKENRNCTCKEKTDLKVQLSGLGDVLNKIEGHLAKKVEKMVSNENTPSGVQTPKMDSSLAFQQEPKITPKSPSAAQQSQHQDQFSLFDKKNVSKKRIDLHELGNFIKKDGKNRGEERRESVIALNGKVDSQKAGGKETEQKKNYSLLSQILPYSDRRQIKIKISAEDILSNYQSKGEKKQIMNIAEEWLGLVYRATASICWNMLSNNLLNFDQTKILFTENIIFNFIQFMRAFKQEKFQNQNKAVELVENINLTSVNVLQFLCTQYPQTKVEDPNIALRSQIPHIDNKGRAKYDFIGIMCKNKEVVFKKKKSSDYTSQIMRVINYMIDRTNKQFNDFNTLMGKIFHEIFVPIQKRKASEKMDQTHEDQIYYQKVKSYTKVLIGRKINKNTPKYTEPQIQNGIFFVKSPSVLRIITKWVQQLDQMVRNPDAQIKRTNKQFKDHTGLPMHLYAQVKNGIHKAIKQNRSKFNQKVMCIKRQCYKLQVLLTYDKFTSDQNQIHLSDEQISVGKYCSYLKGAIASYICSELNSLIDFLLEIPSTIDETAIGITEVYFQEQTKKELDNLNLVNFKIFDLLRCKCISKESQIIYLLRRLNQKSNDQDDPFQIVRIKDRLSTGTRDILINAQIDKGLLFEIQLGVASNLEKKQQLLDQYNHFLYELKRAKLGSITQNAAIWSTLEQRAQYFETSIKKVTSTVKSIENNPHLCITDFRKSQNRKIVPFSRPIICASCKQFLQIPKTCLTNVKCEACGNTFCGQCHFQHLKTEDRKEYVFEKSFLKCLYPYIEQYTDLKKPFPQFGFLIRKKYLKKELFFYRVIKDEIENDLDNVMKIDLVISGIQGNKLVNKTINKKDIEARLENNQYFLDSSFQEELNDYLIYQINIGKNVEKGTLPYKNLLSNFTQQRFKYINMLKHPVYVDDIKQLKKPRNIKSQIQSLKDILSEDTPITYMKVNRTVFILQIQVEENVLHQELTKIINLQRLKNFAQEKVTSVSMEFRQVSDQMDMLTQKFPEHLLKSFSKRVTKLYLNFGKVASVKFLPIVPNLKVLFLRNNKIKSLNGIQNLKNLTILCFDNNQVSSLEPISQLKQLESMSAIGNQLQSLKGVQNLVNIRKFNVFKNRVQKIDYLQHLPNIKELSLNFNKPIVKLENIFHLTKLQEFNIGNTKIPGVEPIQAFKHLKKLAVNDLGLTAIPSMFKTFEEIVKINFAGNQIEKIQNLEELDQLVQLNLRNNRIKVIEGLENCHKLEYIKLGVNKITDISGIKALDCLKVLKIKENPLNDCSEFHLMHKKNFKLIYTLPGEPSDSGERPTQNFYDKYNAIIEHRLSSSSGSNDDSDDDDA